MLFFIYLKQAYYILKYSDLKNFVAGSHGSFNAKKILKVSGRKKVKNKLEKKSEFFTFFIFFLPKSLRV